MSNNDYDSMQSLVDDALAEMKVESGANVNLAELQRRTGISRAKLRRWKDNTDLLFCLMPTGAGKRNRLF